MRKIWTFACGLCIVLAVNVQMFPASNKFPFPRAISIKYRAGILPDHLTPDQLSGETLEFYRQWKARYIRKTDDFSGCGTAGQYVLYVNSDGKFSDDAEALTVSEAHGYGMLIVALMAHEGSDEKAIFDGMFEYFKSHPVTRKPHLMSWKQDKDCKNRDGDSSATDGDEDIAYSLLLADRQWGSKGRINYREEAIAVINAIMRHEIADQDFITAGSSFKNSRVEYEKNATRPSDFMPGHLKAFYEATGDRRWRQVLDKMYDVVDKFQQLNSKETGLLSDVIEDANTDHPRPARADFFNDEGVDAATFNYNACRVPLRLGVDYLMTGDVRAGKIIGRMNNWVASQNLSSPALLRDGYTLDGKELEGHRSLAFSAPFAVMSMERRKSPENTVWLDKSWDLIRNFPIERSDYYGNTLKMMGMIALSGNWWQP